MTEIRELREEIAALVRSAAFPASDAVAELCDKTAELVADRILAIPRLQEALETEATMRAYNDMRARRKTDPPISTNTRAID